MSGYLRGFIRTIKNNLLFYLGNPFWSQIKFETPTLPRLRDFSALFLMLPTFYYIKLLVQGLYKKFGSYILKKIEGIQFICTDDFTRRIKRFSEEGWEVLNHIISATWSYIYFKNFHFWFPNLHTIWPLDPSKKVFAFQFKLFYMYEILFYSELSVSLFIKNRFNDIAMMAHHLSTTLLLISSYIYGYADLGVLVIILHDLADIFVSLSKMFSYVKLTRVSELILFPLLLFCWFIFKLVYFPFYVIRSCIIDTGPYLGTVHSSYGHILTCFLVLLFFLHVYWFYKFCVVFRRILKNRFGKKLVKKLKKKLL